MIDIINTLNSPITYFGILVFYIAINSTWLVYLSLRAIIDQISNHKFKLPTFYDEHDEEFRKLLLPKNHKNNDRIGKPIRKAKKKSKK